MTEEPEQTSAEAVQEPTEKSPEAEQEKAEPARVPHGQALLAGGSTLTLAGAGVWSAWGPWGLAGVGAAGAVAGGAWLHYRYRRGKGEASRETRTTKSSGSSSGGSRWPSLGRGSVSPSGPGASSGRSSTTRSGGTSAGRGKSGGTPGSSGPRPAGGSPRPSGQRPVAGDRPSGGRGAAGRPPTPLGPSKAPDSSTSRKRKGGGMARGTEPGRIRRWLRRADDATGRRASTGWRAARTGIGLRGRYRAAREALAARTSGRPWLNATFAAGTAGLAGLWTLAGWTRARTRAWADRTLGDPEGFPAEAGGTDTPNGDQGSGPPDPDATQKIPQQENPTTSTVGSSIGAFMGLPHADSSNELLSVVGSYEPASAYVVIDESAEWARTVDNWARSIRVYVDRLESSRFPLAPAAKEALYELYEGLAKQIPVAERIPEAMAKPHEHDMARRDVPRGDESKWNV